MPKARRFASVEGRSSARAEASSPPTSRPLKWRIGYLVMFYLISFLPNLLIGVTYARRTRAVSIGRALLLAHLMIIWNYVGYVVTWRALGRMIGGRRGWIKTTRAAEPDTGLIVASPAPGLALSPAGPERNLT